jgi:pimeloyl-ACP methyl ester carboxylesterase
VASPQAQEGRGLILSSSSSTVSSSNGVEVAVHDLAGNGRPLLISHATGFHGRCYLPLAHALANQFHSSALDYRGHGDTALPLDPDQRHIDWESFADDAQAVATSLRATAPTPIVGFGHSMGGACLLMAAHRDASLFERLVLFEPIVYPPPVPNETRDSPALAVGARRRRSSFPSFEAAIANYAAKPPLNAFTPEALEAYVRFGFVEGEDGQVHLKCDPETEASTFEQSAFHPTWAVLDQIALPVMVVAGELAESQPSTMAAQIVERLPNATYVQRDDLDHFGPMTHPQIVAQLVSDFAGAGHR